MEKLWDGVQNLMNLKEVKLSRSENLKELPDLSKATNLELLDISFCPHLTSLAPSILSLNKLERFNIASCSLTKITSENHLSSLSYLNLNSCEKLREFSVTSENMIELDLSNTRVNALPSSFGRQSKLEILWLRGSGIQSFPSSFKNLTRLRYLNLYNSSELHTLTELPPALEILYATDCTSLKTVLFPSVAEQFKENRKEVCFWNCLKLDEHSLKAIGLNAHINMMRFAYQHSLAPDENYDGYNISSYGSYQVKYVYPGSRVPKWLEYKSTKDYEIIDLSSTPPSTLLGFIISFVIPGQNKVKSPNIVFGLRFTFTFYITISDDDEDESKKESVEIYMSDPPDLVVSDHVYVIYDQPCSRYLKRRAKNQTRLKIKVEAMAAGIVRPVAVEIKGFGVSPINTSAYHSFIQQMNTSADHSFIQEINTSADHSFTQQIEVSDSMYFIPMFPIILCISFLLLRRRF